MLNVEDTKMSKSLGNFITMQTVLDKGFEPMTLRYFYYSAHYRSELKFSWEGLKSAQVALQNLSAYADRSEYIDYNLSLEGIEHNIYSVAFLEKLNDDLNVPQALAVLFSMTKDDSLQSEEKKKTLTYAFNILGLNPINNDIKLQDLPEDVAELIQKREDLRKIKNFLEADKIRDTIKSMGYEILDGEDVKVRKI